MGFIHLQIEWNPWLGGFLSPDPRSLCPLFSADFVEPPEKNSWERHCPLYNNVFVVGIGALIPTGKTWTTWKCPSAILSAINPTLTDLGVNPCHEGESPETRGCLDKCSSQSVVLEAREMSPQNVQNISGTDSAVYWKGTGHFAPRVRAVWVWS
jgi:hypothetical protein